MVLLRHMQAVTKGHGRRSGRDDIVRYNFRAQRIHLVVHAGGGLLVLLAATVLAVYKPWT